MIESHRIRIIPFVAGAVEEVLDAYLANGLCDSRFRMQGCKPRHNNSFREESR
jgi:hypothetical protein